MILQPTNPDSMTTILDQLPFDTLPTVNLKQIYFILWTTGENFPSNKSFSTIDLHRHEDYMRNAFKEGLLIMNAFFVNGNGIISLVESESENGVRRFVNKNPEVMDKRIQATIKMCTPVYWKNFDLET